MILGLTDSQFSAKNSSRPRDCRKPTVQTPSILTWCQLTLTKKSTIQTRHLFIYFHMRSKEAWHFNKKKETVRFVSSYAVALYSEFRFKLMK